MEQSIPTESTPTQNAISNGHDTEADPLNLTEEEAQQAPLSAGIRGQIKKIMRSFTHHQGVVMESMRKEIDEFRSRSVAEFTKQLDSTNKRFTDLYNGLVRQLFGQLKPRLYICEVTVQALIDEMTARLQELSSNGQTPEEFKATITKSLQARIAEIDRAYAEKMQAQESEKQQTDEPAMPAPKDAPLPEPVKENRVAEEKTDVGVETTNAQ